MAACELLSACGFFQKYRTTLDMACRGFVQVYCTGSKMAECKRKEYRKEHGLSPVDEMLPSGQMLPRDYR